MDWFYGFKLYLMVNDCGEILACQLTPGNSDDRRAVLPMAQRLFGKLIGDTGYLSKELVAALLQHGVELLTPIRKHRKPRLVRLNDKLLVLNGSDEIGSGFTFSHPERVAPSS